MSKFFHRAASDSDSSETESSEDEQPRPQQMPTKATRPPLADFRAQFSDSDDEEKRVVRSTKDKRYDSIKEIIKRSRNSQKIKDMNKLQTSFDELCRAYLKAKSVIEKEGGVIPRFYIRYLAELEDYINNNWADRKSLNKPNSKGLTTLRQKVRKYNQDFEKVIADYRQSPDPEGYTSSEEAAVPEPDGPPSEDESSDSSEGEGAAYLRKRPGEEKKPKAAVDAGGESDDESWGTLSGSESSESELSDLEGKKMEDLRRFFLKKDYKEGKDDKKDDKKRVERRRRAEERKMREHADEDDEGWEKVQRGQTTEKPKMFEKDAEINHELVLKKLSEIMGTRGKRSTDRTEMVEWLKELHSTSESNNLGSALSAKILLAIAAGYFDIKQKQFDCMKDEVWQSCIDVSNRVLALLVANPNISCAVFVTEETENVQDASQQYRIHGSLLALVEQLDDEFTKILQEADCHSTDYIAKLKGEKDICLLIESAQAYIEDEYERKNGTGDYNYGDICRVYMLRIQHLYYKLDAKSVSEEEEGSEPTVSESQSMMERLCQFVYNHDDTKRLRQRAILHHIYHHALHDRWHQARDLMLMSHLQATVEHSDPGTQILYNRAICQLGLCAFRHGYIKEAHSGLSDIQNTQRAKELLAQGMGMRHNNERTPEQEKLERQRQIPFHMHINVELMECVYLISSMLLEIPLIASQYETRRRMLSRSFHYQLKQSERMALVGPPENTREHVVAASRAMLTGDWKACRDFIVNDKMNAKVWNLFRRKSQVQNMVVRRIQEECLRTYLLTYSTIYTTVSLVTLSEMFELEQKSVHALISKMIFHEELSASLDEPAQCLVMHRVEPTRLQMQALQLTEKLANLADTNDQILEPKSGGQGYARGGNYQSNWYPQRQQSQRDVRDRRRDDRGRDRRDGGGGRRYQRY